MRSVGLPMSVKYPSRSRDSGRFKAGTRNSGMSQRYQPTRSCRASHGGGGLKGNFRGGLVGPGTDAGRGTLAPVFELRRQCT
jgi:hypothetical protein